MLTRLRRGWPLSVVVTTAIAFGVALLAIRRLDYGWLIFVGLPFFIGFFPVAILRYSGPRRLAECFRVASAYAVILSLGFLLAGKEGIICMLLALPLAMPLILLGAGVAYLLLHRSAIVPPGGAAVVLLFALAGGMWTEGRYRPIAPIYTVSDSITIAASPQRVWESLITMGDLGQPPDLLFRLGIACPQRVDIYGHGQGAMRVCTLTTGQLRERVTTWEPGKRLAWISVSTPPPLKELNPFRPTDPPHLHGFYRSVDGQFELTALGPATTRVTRLSSYQHNMFPAAYWRLWCDYVARRGHLHVLGVLKVSAEKPGVSARR